MIVTRAWKKIRGLVECYTFRVGGKNTETVHHLLTLRKKLVGTDYVKQHNNNLKVLAVKWAIENGLLPDFTKWYTTNWERGMVIEKDGKNSSGTRNIL